MSFADDLVAAFAPWMTPDLESYLRTLGEMFAETEWYAQDTEDADGWTVIFDPSRTLYKDLPWLGQIIGERVPQGFPEPLMREWVTDKNNQQRGSLPAILRAAQRHLLGSRVVTWYEKTASLASPGTAIDDLLIITYRDQTPSPDRTLKDLQDVVPGDIVLHYNVQDGQKWQNVDADYGSWAGVNNDFDTWALVSSTDRLVAGNSFSRPVPS